MKLGKEAKRNVRDKMAEEKKDSALNEKKKIKRKIPKSSNLLAVFTIIIPCVLCFFLLVPEIYYAICIDKLVQAGTLNEMIEISILENGLSILGIAVSVWIGLNIYNVIKKSEIDEKIKRLGKANKKLSYAYKKILFLIELEKTKNRYEIAMYFIERFENDTTTPIDNFDKMATFEKKFEECCSAYERKQNQVCNNLARQLRKDEELKKHKLKYKKEQKISLETEYYVVRESDLIFYLYKTNEASAEDKKVSDEDFNHSIQIYEELLERNNNIFDDEVYGYIHNTIAYSYFLLLKNTDDRPDEWIEKAEKSFDIAINTVDKGRYYQNYGAYFEIVWKNYENAKDKYERALKSIEVDNKNWNLLGSVYLKMFEKNTEVKDRFDKGKPLFECDKGNKDNLELLHKAYSYLYLALSKSPELSDVYYNFAKVNLYLWLFEDKLNNNVSFETTKKYLQIAEVSAGNDNTGYLFTLRNYYEAIGDYEKAFETNKKLIGNGVKGDTEGAEKLYGTKRKNTKNFE